VLVGDHVDDELPGRRLDILQGRRQRSCIVGDKGVPRLAVIPPQCPIPFERAKTAIVLVVQDLGVLPAPARARQYIVVRYPAMP